MNKQYRTTARQGLRLRDSPHDGETLVVLPQGTLLDALDEETWVRVRTRSGQVGFVHKGYLNPEVPGEEGPEIHTYTHQNVGSDEPVRLHRDFFGFMDDMARTAESLKLRIHVTSSLRRPRAAVAGAIVPPAKISRHHVGHAVDINLINKDGIWHNSATLASAGVDVARFFSWIESNTTLVWGGAADPVHIEFPLEDGRYVELVQTIWRDLA